ncbi:DJ-1/PfpI family protein [Pseudalkalibacillus sp. SCS-8]|uniref:DJ-1/PfpI family protein n=1 Tax=Pseudalkalibacillus nanhaiensis TaxID=3115291 RepID=UPI0032DAAF36
MNQIHVGILLFDDVDALDFAGPYEVFNLSTHCLEDVQKLFTNRLEEKDKPFRVNTVSEKGSMITVHNGLKVQPDYSFENAPEFDLIVVPGGPASAITSVMSNRSIIEWIASYGAKDKHVISVCTGALFLAEAGLLNGQRATTNRAAITMMQATYPSVTVVEDVKFVDEGRVVTAAGVSAGINMALHVVGKMFDEGMAKRTAETIEFSTETTSAHNASLK